VSDEEAWHTSDLGDYLAISSMLPEIPSTRSLDSVLRKEYSSADNVLNEKETYQLLLDNNLLIAAEEEQDEFLR
jgi:hypothetical protein